MSGDLPDNDEVCSIAGAHLIRAADSVGLTSFLEIPPDIKDAKKHNLHDVVLALSAEVPRIDFTRSAEDDPSSDSP
jgi:hypothetical protein